VTAYYTAVLLRNPNPDFWRFSWKLTRRLLLHRRTFTPRRTNTHGRTRLVMRPITTLSQTT